MTAVKQGWSKWEPGNVNPEAKNKPRDICPVKKGYGMGVVSISPIVGASLYSVADKLSKIIPTTLDENRYFFLPFISSRSLFCLHLTHIPAKKQDQAAGLAVQVPQHQGAVAAVFRQCCEP
jgi:hypothetical protein